MLYLQKGKMQCIKNNCNLYIAKWSIYWILNIFFAFIEIKNDIINIIFFNFVSVQIWVNDQIFTKVRMACKNEKYINVINDKLII